MMPTTTRSSASPATRPTTRSSARTARWRASTTPTATPTTPTPRRSSRRSTSPTRRCAIRSAVVVTTSSAKTARARRWRRRRRAARRSASATSSTRSSAATRSATARPGRPAARARRRGRRRTSTSRRPRSAPPPRSRSASRSRASAARARAVSRARTRRAATSAAAPARCARSGARSSARSSPPRRASRAARPAAASPHRAASAAATVGSARRARSTSRCPPASTTASVSASPVAGPPRRAAASPATSTSPCASRPTPASSARATTSSTCARIAFTQATLGTHLDIETLEGLEELIVPPGTQPGHVFRLKGRGVPALRGRGRGDLLVRVDVEVPTRLSAEEDELAALARRRCAARRSRRARQGRVLPAQVRVPVSAADGAAGRRRSPCRRGCASRTSTSTASTTRITVDGDDGHHLQRARRLRAGRDRHRGRRLRPLARLTDRRRGDGRVELAATHRRSRTSRTLAPRLTVACSLTKGEKPELVVQKLTELGVDRILLVEAARSVVRWDDAKVASAFDRLATGRARSRRRSRAGPGSRWSTARCPRPRWRRCPGSWSPRSTASPPPSSPAPAGGEWVVAVGPEGGFDPDRARRASAHAPRLAVGPFVLRAETAAIAGDRRVGRAPGVFGRLRFDRREW